MSKYRQALANLPPSGSGRCHTALLGLANHAVYEKVSETEFINDVQSRWSGSRIFTQIEPLEAYRKALNDKRPDLYFSDGTRYKPYNPIKKKRRWNPAEGFKRIAEGFIRIIERGKDFDEEEIRERSRNRLTWKPGYEDTIEVLTYLYKPSDLLYIGGRYDDGRVGVNIRPAGDWIDIIEKTKTVPGEHFMPNPLSGEGVERTDLKTGKKKLSFRADGCIKSFIFANIEFDSKPEFILTESERLAYQDSKKLPAMPIEMQCQFWGGIKLDIAALIHSGNKSLHAWVKVDCKDRTEWTQVVERKLFKELLEPLGIDGACKNEARLSRTPGFLRAETGKVQRLMFLAPEGSRVNR